MMIDLANSIEKLRRKFRFSREFSTNHNCIAALFIFGAGAEDDKVESGAKDDEDGDVISRAKKTFYSKKSI